MQKNTHNTISGSYRYLTTALLLLALAAGVSACNTANGFGRDLEGAGRTIQNTF